MYLALAQQNMLFLHIVLALVFFFFGAFFNLVLLLVFLPELAAFFKMLCIRDKEKLDL
jgi:hypothetical protein